QVGRGDVDAPVGVDAAVLRLGDGQHLAPLPHSGRVVPLTGSGVGQFGVDLVIVDLHVKGEQVIVDHAPLAQHRTGNDHHLVGFRVGRVDDGQLGGVAVLEVVGGPALFNGHVALNREQAGDQLAKHHDDQAAVQDED